MAGQRVPLKSTLINIPVETVDWLKKNAAAADRTLTAEINRILRAAKAVEDQRKAG